jgi:hypothetical protein
MLSVTEMCQLKVMHKPIKAYTKEQKAQYMRQEKEQDSTLSGKASILHKNKWPARN